MLKTFVKNHENQLLTTIAVLFAVIALVYGEFVIDPNAWFLKRTALEFSGIFSGLAIVSVWLK